MIGVAVFGITCQSLARVNFGVISYNITYDIRRNLYESILIKNIGYFDFQENSTPVLSSIMQNDTTIINGVATDSIPPILEAVCIIVMSFACSFYLCW